MKVGISKLFVSITLLILVGAFFLIQLGSWNMLIYRPGSEFSDLTVTFWPNIHYIQQSLREYGQFPLWRTLIFSGGPFDSDPQSGLWYLPNLIFLVIPINQGFNLLFVIHMVAGGLGMWHWARATGTSPGGSLIAAIAVAFTPKVYAHLGFGHIGLVYGAAYIPWVFWATYLTAKGRFQYTGVIALALGFQIIANPQIATYTGLVSAAYGFATTLWGTNNNLKRILTYSAILVTAVLISFTVAGIMMLPMLRFAPLSARSGMELADTVVSSLPPRYLFGLLLADHIGFMDYVIYVGLPVTGLSILALPRRQAWFWWAFVVLALLYAMGDITPIYSVTFKLIPLISWLRAPTRILFIQSVVMALLAGWGFDHLIIGMSILGRKLFNLVAVGVGAFSLTLLIGYIFFIGWAPANLIVFGFLMPVTMALFVLIANKKIVYSFAVTTVIVILIVDLWVVNGTFIEGRDPGEDLYDSGLGRYLVGQKDDEQFRIYSPSYSLTRLKGAYFNIESADGVDPLYTKEYDQFMQLASGVVRHRYEVTIPPFEGGNSVYDANINATPRLDLLGILSVKYIASEFPLELDGLEEVAQYENTFVYENAAYMPRAYVLGAVEAVESFDAAMEWLKKNDPSHQAVVIGGPPLKTESVQYQIEWIDRSPNKQMLEVKLDRPGYLILSQASFPDWQVYVDGEKEILYRVNGILSGVLLEEGTHQVTFKYEPSTLCWGIVLSIFGLVVSMLLITKTRSISYGKNE